KPLGQILRERQALAADEHELLDALVQKHLAKHGNDPRRSLAAVSSLGSAVRRGVEQGADPDGGASGAAAASQHDDPCRTVAPPPEGAAPAPVRYRILRKHARGGLGEVYVAEDTELGRQVALKEIQDRHADDPASRQRFVIEAEVTGGLEHPGIVPVYGLGS